MSAIDIQPLIDLMATLRDKDKGCDWDLAQTHESLVPLTAEEALELYDAIARADIDNICEELGDVLFHLVFYARIAEEQGDFTIQQVIDGVVEKMIRRHPHIFEGKVYADAAAQKADWARIKAEEKATKTFPYPQLSPDNHYDNLPAIAQSMMMQKQLAEMGFDWFDAHSVFDKVTEEMHELQDELKQADNTARVQEEYGDLLFAVLNLGRKLAIDPDMALRKANHKFYARSEAMLAMAGGLEPFASQTMDEKEQLWREVKKRE